MTVALGLLDYVVSLAIMVSIFATLGLGLNLQWGYGGLFNIGIAGFFLLGAYTSALVTSSPPGEELAGYVTQAVALGAPFPVGVLAAAAACGLIAWLVGLATLKLSGDYLAITTIGISESIRIFFRNELWLANGHRGLIGIPGVFGDLVSARSYNYFYLVVCGVILALMYLLQRRLTDSPWGRALRAVRDDSLSAAMSGKDTFRYRLQALVVGAMIMGVAGAMLAHFDRVLSPDVFVPLYGTFIVWVMVMTGGSGNNRGVLVGAGVIWAIWEGTRFLTDGLLPPQLGSRAPFIRFLLIGLVLLIVLIKRPRGLIPEESRVSRFARAIEERVGLR